MARINLLPWREELRKEKQKEFNLTMFLGAVLAAAVVGAGWFHMESRIENQQARNAFIQDEIKALDKQIAEIKDLEKQKKNLLARMNIIQQLQRSRPEVVHVFDDLVKTLPEGLYLTGINNKGSVFNLNGFAQSNARVSSYMRNIDTSKWLSAPSLKTIVRSGDDASGRTKNKFILSAKQRSAAVVKKKKKSKKKKSRK